MTTKLRAAIGALSACAVLIGALVGPAGAQESELDGRITNVYTAGNGMTFQKVSHPENGLETADGVVDYIGGGTISAKDQGQGDRGQSYATPPNRSATRPTSARCTEASACRRSSRAACRPTWA